MGIAPVSTPIPADLRAAIRATKAELRARVGDVAGVFGELSGWIAAEVEEVARTTEREGTAFPVVEFADVAAGTVPDDARRAIVRRGCVVVRGTFPRGLAEQWNDEIGLYLQHNGLWDGLDTATLAAGGGAAQRGAAHPGVGRSGVEVESLALRPSIFPVYWSRPQVLARQHENLVAVRRFLNGFWRHESEGRRWFDPDRDAGYVDRVRRREPGVEARGLLPHVDSGSIERWLLPAYQQVFRHVFSGDWRAHDPWDAAYRTDVDEYESPVMTSAFRSFQGWTALSSAMPADGVLHAIPIPSAISYVLLRALQDDVADDDLCGAANGKGIRVLAEHHGPLLPALTPIPAVKPGDSVWWHADLIHSVAGAASTHRWGNVMYIPASPWCDKNAAYARHTAEAFRSGRSPTDFPADDLEVNWVGRATEADLDDVGRRQFGLDPW